jgi:hypothetical protein
MTATLTRPPGLVLPRYGTPRNPARETRGHEMAEVARRLGQPLMPWQQHVADVALEVDPETGELYYTEIVLTIMRQCGKTMGWMWPWLVWRMTVVPHRLGRQNAVFTMQDRAKARVKLERDMAEALRARPDDFHEITNPKARPSRSTRQWKLGLNNGSEHLLFGRGNYLSIETPSEKAGHSGTLDAAGIDEARFHRDGDVESGVVPTMSTRTDQQLLVASTAGNHLSYYFWPKVLGGRQMIDQGVESRTAFFDWSIPDEADIDDPAVWAAHHPALGHTITLDFIFDKIDKARRSPDPDKGEDSVRNEYANQWVTVPVLGDGLRPMVIAPDVWETQKQPAPFAGPGALGVDVSRDGASASISIAGRDSESKIQTKVLKLDPGTFWLEAELKAFVAEHQPTAIAYDAGNPANAAVAGQIARAAGTTPVMRLQGSEWSASCAAYVTGFREGAYRHHGQLWLDSALQGAAKKQRGAGWLWDHDSALADITPICSSTAAVRAVEMTKPEPVRRSAYEDDGLTTV